MNTLGLRSHLKNKHADQINIEIKKSQNNSQSKQKKIKWNINSSKFIFFQ